MTSQQEAISKAGQILARARRERDLMPVEEAARAAWHPGGPPVEQIEALIRAQRKQSA